MPMLKFAASVLMLVASSAHAAPDRVPPDRPPSEMTSSQIKAFNAGLESIHPYFIRCRKTEVIGSLVKKLRVCRTNEQWKASADAGNANAREILDAMSRAPVNSN